MTGEDSEEMDRKIAEEVKRRLAYLEMEFGEVPLLAQELSSYPDIFLPHTELMNQVLLNPKHLDKKTAELAAIAAGTALGGEHCLAVHLRQAQRNGASKDELVEAMMVGAVMSMTVSQSVGLRKIKELG